MNIKKIAYAFVIIMIIQLFRMCSKYLIFLFINRDLLSDMIFNMICSIIMIVIFMIIIKKKDIKILPRRFTKYYILVTAFIIVFFFLTIFITKNYKLYGILSLIYNSIFTVILEETIFRSFIWNYFENYKNKYVPYVVSTILFGLWHLGYIDTILWRTTFFNINANILNIMIWKVITGFVLGIIFGFFRYKSKNSYLSMTIHSLINMIGS